MGTAMNELEAIYNTPGEPAIVLRVHRPASDEEAVTSEATRKVLAEIETRIPMGMSLGGQRSTAVLMSDQFAQLTVAGVVDYAGIRMERPIFSPLPNVHTVRGNPLVWLARGMRGAGHRCIVQSDENGDPILANVIAGGNFAFSSHVDFGRMVGDNYGAVPIFDKPARKGGTAWGQ